MSKEREEGLKALDLLWETSVMPDKRALATYKKVKKYIELLEKGVNHGKV